MAKALSTAVYRKLHDEISAIYIASQQKAARALDQISSEAHWQIGERIVTVEQDNAIRAQYGDHLLERLSTSLTKKHGNGFSITNLKNMRKYYRAFPIRQPVAELGWTKQCILLSIENEGLRKKYEKKAVKEDWSKNELLAVLKKDKVKRQREKEGPASVTAQPAAEKPATREKPSLPYTRGRLNLCQVVEIVHPETKRAALYLDPGFRMHRPFPENKSLRLKKDTVVDIRLRAGKHAFAPTTAATAQCYTYKVQLIKVIDGDTLWALIDPGLGTLIVQKLRLRGIDCPEIDTPEGKRAKRFVQRRLKGFEWFIVKTWKDTTDKYDRYLADIFYAPNERDPQKSALEGRFLNQELLDAGLAEIWKD